LYFLTKLVQLTQLLRL